MKRVLFIFWIFSLAHLAYGQLALVPEPKHLILLGGRSDPIMWPEFGYMYLGKKYQSFQVKASIVKDVRDYSELKGNYNGYFGTGEFISNYYYIKPGYVILKSKSTSNNFFVIVNGLFSYSENQLILTVSDPLLGKVKQISYDNQFYKALELEMKWHLDLNKHVAFSVGGFAGLFLDDPILFEDAYNGGFSNKEFYKPGIGYFNNFYYMMYLGLAIKPY